MTGPLAPLFAQVREARPHVPKNPCLMCEHDYCQCRTDQAAFNDALSSIERHVQDMEKQAALDAERAAVLSSAVGKARLILNDVSAETTALIDAALPARGKGTPDE